MAFKRELHLFPADHLANFCTAVFMYFSIPEADATQAAEVLAKSDLRGIDSHGVARLHIYLSSFKNVRAVRENSNFQKAFSSPLLQSDVACLSV